MSNYNSLSQSPSAVVSTTSLVSSRSSTAVNGSGSITSKSRNGSFSTLASHDALDDKYDHHDDTHEGTPLASITVGVTPLMSSPSPSPLDSHSPALSPQPLLDKYGKPIVLGQGTLASCTAAMTNTILGAGMLGLPHAMAESGFGLGSILLVLAGCAAAFALHLLSVSAKTVGIFPSSFYVVATAAVPRSAWLIDLAVAIKCFGVATSYLIVIGDLLPEATKSLFGANHGAWLYDRRTWIALYMGCIVLPLSCLRSLHALRFTATASIFFVAFLTGVITLYATVPSLDACAGRVLDECAGPTVWFQMNRGTLKILSIFIFGFTCHQNIFSACNELNNFTIPRINKVISSCIGIAFVIYAFIASMGYYTYGSQVASNILKNYPDNIAMAVARILVATNCAFTFPLQCNPCRNSISLLMFQWKNRHMTMGKIGVHQPSELRLTILTGLICSAAFGVAMVVSDLGVILAIVGATGSTTISYILPGLIFLKVHPVWTQKHYFAALLLGVGCIVIPSCLTFIFL